ncbi:MAG: amino acid ABC transporter ATP-binding/permease protein [Coprobacillaceae bacterium]
MKRSANKVMLSLIGLITPLLHVMIIAIILGIIGYLYAIFITVLAAMSIASLLDTGTLSNTILIIMMVGAIARGFLRYGEQACNHYIAFKLLALIRHKVFVKLRNLAPAKLEGKDKGNLISIITNDIELLEVFYAHTISPIVIAFIVSLIMLFFVGQYHIGLACIALLAYIWIGAILPIYFSKKGSAIGQSHRDHFGKMNSFVLESIRGIKESMQFKHGEKRLQEMNNETSSLEDKQGKLKRLEALNKGVTDISVLLFSFLMFVGGLYLYNNHDITFTGLLVSTIAMFSSVGPVVALSSLSNNLYHTIASGNRVLDLLEEEPIVQDIVNQETASFGDINFSDVTFSYDGKEKILEDINLGIKEKEIIGIHGKSGSGKSTLLKLLMRFWSANNGNITIDNRDIEGINTNDLRNMEAYVTQDTYVFNDSLASNISLGKADVSIEQIVDAAKKASIHDFIMELPKGYETNVGELGGSLSGGERQRIGLARAFLHQTNLILLDEPTSNLDSLNEAIILQTLQQESKEKTIILVSHRKSTMSIVDTIYTMKDMRNS